MIFKNIFSSYYSFFLRQKATGPIYSTVNLLALALMVWSMLIYVLLDKCFGFKLFSILFSSVFFVSNISFIQVLYKK